MVDRTNLSGDSKINNMIQKWSHGDTSIEDCLFNELYPILREIVHREHRKINILEMNTTLLVNETYLKLKEIKSLKLNNKDHLLALSARIIRFLLVDTIKREKSLKRGGSFQKLTLQESSNESYIEPINIDFINLHQLLFELEKVDKDAVRIIELRYFAGLSIEETAKVMSTNSTQISRNWKFAKTWLFDKLKTYSNV